MFVENWVVNSSRRRTIVTILDLFLLIVRVKQKNLVSIKHMSDKKSVKSGIAMVCISGSEVRHLREQQNLTQLYLATAVGVTTETISRWERQGSPTVKEENGVKLAEVLGVSLEQILFSEDAGAVAEKIVEPEAETAIRPARIVAMALVAFIVLLSVTAFFFVGYQSVDTFQFSARRVMPTHTVSTLPFPVVVTVAFVSEKESSLLLKEELPPGCNVLRSVPPATLLDRESLKWIDKKGHGLKKFAYLASCSSQGKNQETQTFIGSLLVRQESHREIIVDGPDRLKLLEYHWADSDMDNVIDDEELLAVYDDFGSVEGLGVDVEEVERIWMGSGYRWKPQEHMFEIIP